MKRYMPLINYIITYANEKNKSIIGRELGDRFSLSEFTVRQYINEARSDGFAVCSCHRGYYYSADGKDLDKTIRSLRGRIEKLEMALCGLYSIRSKIVGEDNE